MSKRDVRDARKEFKGSEGVIGEVYGSEGKDKIAAVHAIEKHLARDLTTAEYVEFTNGWLVGWNEYVERQKKAEKQFDETIYPAPDFGEIPL